jgi:hypothetical protein
VLRCFRAPQSHSRPRGAPVPADTPEQMTCGAPHEEACLNIFTGTYSCTSPDPATGATLHATLWNAELTTRHHPNSPYMCKPCSTEGAYACDCAKGECTNTTGTSSDTMFCQPGLTLVEADVSGKFYCNHPHTVEPSTTPPDGTSKSRHSRMDGDTR